MLKRKGIPKSDRVAYLNKALLLASVTAILKDKNDLENRINEITRSYDEVIGLLTHEFKNILNSAHGYNMILEQNLNKSSDQEAINALRASDRLTRQLFDMVDSLLRMSMSEKGLLKPERKLIDFKENVLAPLESDLQPQLLKKNMKIVVVNNSDYLVVEADGNLLDIVMRNLLINAVKYGNPDSDIIITLSNDKNNFRVSVRNECKQIPKGFTDKIFEKFRSQKIGDVKGGTGIGLYNVKNIIQLHGGSIGKNFAAGEWIEFNFNLPRRTDPR
jgi:signal transduction histidine kinase